MLLLFFCSNHTLPLSAPPAADMIEGRSRPVCDERLARCLASYPGVFGVLATRLSPDLILGEAQAGFGPSGSRIMMFVHPQAESPYQFVSDFLGARNVSWIALAESRESFPATLQHRVVELDVNRDELERACSELDRLLSAAGKDATTVGTSDEMFHVFVDRPESLLYKARRTLRNRLPTEDLEAPGEHRRRRHSVAIPRRTREEG